MTQKHAHHRFMKMFSFSMALYGLSCFVVPYFLRFLDESHWIVYCVSILPAIFLLLGMWSVWSYMITVDEYIRYMQIKAIMIAVACTLALTTTFGFLQIYAGLADFPVFFILPIFCMFYAVGTAVVWLRRDKQRQNS